MEKRLTTRSKTELAGCLTCRKRKLKCDETRPICTRCTTQSFSCDWPKAPASCRGQHQVSEKCALGCRVPDRHSQLATSVVTLRSSLQETQWECANSVRLTPHDRHYLEYFSSSVTCGRYGFGQWCILQYVVREIAPSNSGVLCMILALSASEIHKNGFHRGPNSKGKDVDPGIYHYNLALKHLCNCLEKKRGVGDEEGVHAIIATIFFMVQYELQFSASTKRVKVHIAGLWAVISTHPLFQGKGGYGKVPHEPPDGMTDTPFVLSCQLIVWLLYTDVMATGAGASTSLLRLLSSSTYPCLEPSRLYRTAQEGISRVWDKRPPPTQQLFNMDIYRPVELGQQLLSIRFNIWELRTQGKSGHDEGNASASLLEQLLQLGKEYIDVLQLAETTATMPSIQTMETVTRTVASYWACILFHRRMLGHPGPQNHLHHDAVVKLTDLLYLHYEHEQAKPSHSRLVWPTFIAAIEVHDRIHRSWLLGKLRDARNLSMECEWAYSMAEEILRIQTAPGMPWVDLAEYMQSQDENDK